MNQLIKIYSDLNSPTFKKIVCLQKKTTTTTTKQTKKKIKVKANFVIKGKNIFK